VCQEPLDEIRNNQNFLAAYVTETKPGFTLTTQNPTAVLTVEKSILSTCKESPEIGIELNPLNAELNSICHLLALLGAHHIFHIRGLRVKEHVSDYFFCEFIVYPVFFPPG